MDDPLIENFREAGCVIVGRTAVPEDGMTLLTHSIKYGDVRSPGYTHRAVHLAGPRPRLPVE